MYILLRQYVSGEYEVSEYTETYYVCNGTITDILAAITLDVKQNLRRIKADTFRVETYECITVECELRTSDPIHEFEKIHWCIVPIKATEILLW